MGNNYRLEIFTLFCIICVTLWGTHDLQTELERTRAELEKYKTNANYISSPIVDNDNLERQIDSLSIELFQKSTELERCNISLDYLNEINPKAYKQYELFYETQTE